MLTRASRRCASSLHAGDAGVFIVRAAVLASGSGAITSGIEHLPSGSASPGDALLEYAIVPAGLPGGHAFDAQHTVTPAAARGRGVAAALTLAALRWARAAGAASVLPSCTYTQVVMERARGSALPGVVFPLDDLRFISPPPGVTEVRFVADEADAAAPPPR